MNRHPKARAVAQSTQHHSFYQPSGIVALLALILALFLMGHGMARAADLPQADSSQPAPDAAPSPLVCTDNMDFSPEDVLPSPFDADGVAFHPARARPFAALMIALPETLDDGCQGPSERLDNA
jgi:hypothetical protein